MMERMELAVEVRGAGPKTLLLLHGLGASHDHFDDVADALGGRALLVLPDLRGHGDSPPGPVEAIDDYVRDLVPIVRAHGPLAVCGLSFGGDLALHLWQAAPDAISAVVVVDPLLDAAGLWSWARARVTAKRDALREILSPFFERDLDRLVALMAEYPLTADLDEAARRRNARSHLRAAKETLHGTLRILEKLPPLPGRPAGSSAAALVVRAARSIACPPGAAAEFAERIDANLETINAGHCVSLSEPQRFAALLSSWLRLRA
jgi:pimeloyl-ACP methyl ester carboxylesterase